MECPKCEHRAYVAETKSYRHKAGDPLEQIRTYICSNPDCAYVFRYRNSFLDEAKARDALRWVKAYEQRKARQHNLFEEETTE